VAFTKSNIESAFTATGIFPYNPEIVQTKITRSTTPPNKHDLTLTSKTPLSGHAIRKAAHMLREHPSNELLNRILRGSERIAAMHECAQHEIRGLIEAIALEKKKQIKGK